MPSRRAPRRCRRASSRRPARPCSAPPASQDSPAQFAADIQAKAHGTAAAHLVAAFSGRIGAVLDTLQARHGIAFEVLDGFLYPGHSVRRMHAVPQKTGAALVAQLERAATAAGADIVTQATVRELWVDGAGRITGVGYERPDGRMEHLRCDALILACNGFGGNPAMVRELLPEMAMRCSPATPATTAAPSPGAARWARGWPIWAATRAMARGRSRRAR
jgi:aspartate oxidase